MKYVFLTVETGFRANEITLLEGNSGTMCLNTVGTVFSDTVINVTLIEGSAGAGGEVSVYKYNMLVYSRYIFVWRILQENIPSTFYKYIYVSETATDFLRGLRTLTCMLKITKKMGQRLCSVS